jgi:hypothetical protein
MDSAIVDAETKYINYMVKKGFFTLPEPAYILAPCVCNICEDMKANQVFNPCGHIVCKKCLPKLNNVCHICRSKIKGAITLYLS